MHRLFAVLLLALLGLATTAAPAPEPWVAHWDVPVDPLHDCRFDRDWDKLTITVPGGGHILNVMDGNLNAPRLLRDVEGDFVVQVRVSGAFKSKPGAKDEKVFQRAGILVTDGRQFVRVERIEDLGQPKYPVFIGIHEAGTQYGLHDVWTEGPPLEKPGYLRLERRGTRLRVWDSEDGDKWTLSITFTRVLHLSKKLKVGVIAEATGPGKFRPWFDSFKLSRPDAVDGPRGFRLLGFLQERGATW